MIQEEELYNDGETKLIEFRVMLDGECIARSWRELKFNKREGTFQPTSGGGIEDGDISHYTLPKWYVRQQKLDEIL